jgi:transposase
LGYRWRRFRKCIKKCQDPEKYQSIVNELCQLLSLEESGYLKIYYGDESGFSLDPCIPYGWQPQGQYIKIAPKKSQRLNIFGLLSKDNHLQAYSTTGTICADMVIAFLDDFSETITQKTVVVLDNATIHHSDELKDKMQEWEQKDLYIFFLPTYSPHLNLIETLWRMIKYRWLKAKDYLDFSTLTEAVENIINDIGKNLKINFSENKYFTDYKLSII